MKIRVKFFSEFRGLFEAREKDMDLAPESRARNLLDILCDTPARRAEVFQRGELRRRVIIMRNGAPLPSSTGLDTRLAEGDLIALFPFVGGG